MAKKAPAWENRIVGDAIIQPQELHAHPDNFRTHGLGQQRALTGAIARLGWIQRVVVNKRTGRIVDGHLRVKLAERHNEPVPVLYVDLTDEEERLALASLDPIAALAGQDNEAMARLLDGLRGGDAKLDKHLDALRAAMMDAGQPKKGKTDPDAAPPPPAKVRTKRGETWRLGAHVLRVGDGTSNEDVGAAMDGEHADAVWTDPPYNVAYEGTDGMTIENDDLDAGAFATFLVDLLSAARAHTEPGGAVYIAHADSAGRVFREAADTAGWSIRQCLIWVKNTFTIGRQDYQWRHEPILYGWNPGAGHRWFGNRDKGTVIDDRIDIDAMSKADLKKALRALLAATPGTVIDADKPRRNALHPTMKPVGLIIATLGNSIVTGDRVLDPCAGSGSTMIACEQLGAIAHLVEWDQRYADAIIQRWQEFTGMEARRASDGVTFASVKPREPE